MCANLQITVDPSDRVYTTLVLLIVLIDIAAQEIDPSYQGSHNGSPTGSIAGIKVLSC